MKVERKNKDLKLIKAMSVTVNEKLFAALKWVLVFSVVTVQVIRG
jgi:hypothetical protein